MTEVSPSLVRATTSQTGELENRSLPHAAVNPLRRLEHSHNRSRDSRYQCRWRSSKHEDEFEKLNLNAATSRSFQSLSVASHDSAMLLASCVSLTDSFTSHCGQVTGKPRLTTDLLTTGPHLARAPVAIALVSRVSPPQAGRSRQAEPGGLVADAEESMFRARRISASLWKRCSTIADGGVPR